MIVRPTVLVLGAGASIPYGFPSGQELLDDVIDLLAANVSDFMRSKLNSTEAEIKVFLTELRGADTPSVDAFLQFRPSFVDLGKRAIANALIPYEERAEGDLRGGWYQYLFERLATDPSEFGSNQLTIITFNYDRSLEAYLFRGLQKRFGLDADVALGLLKTLPVHHVHGHLGSFDPEADDYLPFGSGATTGAVQAAAKSLRIVHEELQESGVIHKARTALARAHHVCYLGFGYHEPNLRRLAYSSKLTDRAQSIYGTTLGMGVQEARDAEHYVQLYSGKDTGQVLKPRSQIVDHMKLFPGLGSLEYLRNTSALITR